LDHCGALPYFLEKTDFQGKVYMTHPTKAIYNYVLSDYVKISNIPVDEMLFDENDVKNSLEKIILIDYHQEREYNGIKFCCYNAGHVLGATMFMVEIDNVRVRRSNKIKRFFIQGTTQEKKIDI
jgi:cleavage and polyadenylation specificity factor subunit 3